MLGRQPMLWSVKPAQVQGRIDKLAGWLGCSEVGRRGAGDLASWPAGQLAFVGPCRLTQSRVPAYAR
jgi:hypothetical protein